MAMSEGPRSQASVMFEPETWKGLSDLVDALREERCVRSSRNALLVAVLADPEVRRPRSISSGATTWS